MSRERFPADLTLHSPAKVNLFLEVLGKRSDGYHELASLMLAVDLEDTLEFTRTNDGQVTLECDQPGLSCGPDNLVRKAADALRRFGLGNRSTGQCVDSDGARIHLTKRIPLQAGLAGGSSNAAATLIGLNRLWKMGISRDELMQIGSTVGSDVNFFLAGTAAWCTGRGEKVESMTMGRQLDFVLACPQQGLSTAEVFRNVRIPKTPLDGNAVREALIRGDVMELGRRLHNRLQESAEELCPAIAVLCRAMTNAGVPGCRMTGSGSAVFAICRDRSEAIRVASSLDAAVPAIPLRLSAAAVSPAVIRGFS